MLRRSGYEVLLDSRCIYMELIIEGSSVTTHRCILGVVKPAIYGVNVHEVMDQVLGLLGVEPSASEKLRHGMFVCDGRPTV